MTTDQQATEVASAVTITVTNAVCKAQCETFWADQIAAFDFDEAPQGGGTNSYAGGGASRGCCTRNGFGECQAKFLSTKTQTIDAGVYGYEATAG